MIHYMKRLHFYHWLDDENSRKNVKEKCQSNLKTLNLVKTENTFWLVRKVFNFFKCLHPCNLSSRHTIITTTTSISTFSHFLLSSICSTSLDSSTTLPLIIVWVTTFTIFLVRTSGSSAGWEEEGRVRRERERDKEIMAGQASSHLIGWNGFEWRTSYFWVEEELPLHCRGTERQLAQIVRVKNCS